MVTLVIVDVNCVEKVGLGVAVIVMRSNMGNF